MTTSTQPDDRSTAVTRWLGSVTGWLGSFPVILLSFAVVAAWMIGGVFVVGGLTNNAYEFLINTGTTVITFWMVFIIQNTQNRQGKAMQAKLDAQSEALRRLAKRLEVADDERLLIRTVGLEDAPAKVIANDHERVRQAAVDTGEHKRIDDGEEAASAGSRQSARSNH